jgi:hypothetical protein
MERAAMSEFTLTERLMAAYQFVAQRRGDVVSLLEIRLFLVGPHPVGAHELNPLLRQLNGTVVDFFGDEGGQGLLTLHEEDDDTTWDEMDGGVDIEGTLYTHMSVEPRG